VLGTDGLFDNLYPEEIASIVYEAKEHKPSRGNRITPEALASLLANQAHEIAVDEGRDTPFSYGARQAGWDEEYGGKMDDCTVVVTYVNRHNSRQPAPYIPPKL